MKIALIGYGKLGKAIEEIAIQRGHEILLRVTKANAETYDLTGCEMAVECSSPETAIQNIRKCVEFGVPVVVGSTGWYNHFEEIKNLTEAKSGSLLYATNFSIGVHLFWEANKALANLMCKMTDYDVSITEVHHTAKKDAPSGTAITTAEILMEILETKKQWELVSANSVIDKSSLMITANREGDAKGLHKVIYQGAFDRIELIHEAFSREGFARGAVAAAEFLKNKKGVYSMRDVLHHYIN